MTSIVLENVNVKFPIYGVNAKSLKGRLLQMSVGGLIDTHSRGVVSIDALRNISCRFHDGDRIGLVGHNGAGKSTLLRVLSRVYAPCSGSLRISGRVSALFHSTLGMNMDCTGRENIFLRGIYLGMDRAEVLRRMDGIVEFTELGDFLEMPLRTYSIGMQLRLAFAVSTCFEPDILLLDEVFGGGDSAFIERADRRLEEFLRSAGIVVLASHSEHIIRKFCDKAVLLEHGQMVAFGSVDEIFDRYNGSAPPQA